MNRRTKYRPSDPAVRRMLEKNQWNIPRLVSSLSAFADYSSHLIEPSYSRDTGETSRAGVIVPTKVNAWVKQNYIPAKYARLVAEYIDWSTLRTVPRLMPSLSTGYDVETANQKITRRLHESFTVGNAGVTLWNSIQYRNVHELHMRLAETQQKYPFIVAENPKQEKKCESLSIISRSTVDRYVQANMVRGRYCALFCLTFNFHPVQVCPHLFSERDYEA